jgi:hypothetical protein
VDDAVFLKRYYIANRYPDDLPEDIPPEEVSEALKATSHLPDFVLAQVKGHGAAAAENARVPASGS